MLLSSKRLIPDLQLEWLKIEDRDRNIDVNLTERSSIGVGAAAWVSFSLFGGHDVLEESVATGEAAEDAAAD